MAGFTCPSCTNPAGLLVDVAMSLRADSRSDEILVQLLRCSLCGFDALAAYEESRRGPLGADHFSHTGYPIDSATAASWRIDFSTCPDLNDIQCHCTAHAEVGRQTEAGRWVGLPIPAGGFSIQIFPSSSEERSP